MSSMFTWVSAYGGIVATKLLSDFDYINNVYLPTLAKALDERRKYVGEILAANHIPYTIPDAAFFVFIDLCGWLWHFEEADQGRELALLKYLMNHGVFLEPGQAFSSTMPGFFRLNYGGEETMFKLGMERLVLALKELDGDESKIYTVEIPDKRFISGWKLLSCIQNSD